MMLLRQLTIAIAKATLPEARKQRRERARRLRHSAPQAALAALQRNLGAIRVAPALVAQFRALPEGEQLKIAEHAGSDLAAVLPLYLSFGDKAARLAAFEKATKPGLDFRTALETLYLEKQTELV